MTLVNAPAATRRRSARSSDVLPAAAQYELDQAFARVLRPDTYSTVNPLVSAGYGTLPAGVVDTRAHGISVIDLREGVQVRDGVVDTRPHGVAMTVDIPPNPFVGHLPVENLPVEHLPVEQSADVPAPPPPPIKTSQPYMKRSEMRRLEARASRRSPATLNVPQVGIVSALGLATIAAPLTGALNAPSQAGANQLVEPASAAAVVVAAPVVAEPLAFPQTVPVAENAVEAARVVVDESQVGAVPDTLAPPSRLLVTRASRGGTGRAVLPGCDGEVSAAAQSASNGRLPESALCTLWDGNEKLRADAAVDFARLNVAYKQEFGKDMCVTDSYRTLSEQYTIKRLRGGFAAAPGTSEHGWGLAVDLCGGSRIAGTPAFTWLRANAGRYGWENPNWAQAKLYEPWHWEYAEGRD